MWALARWFDAGDRHGPYLVPFERVAAMEPFDPSAAAAMRRAVIADQIERAMRLGLAQLMERGGDHG